MALVRSFIAPNEDEPEDDVEYYVGNILVVKDMKRLMNARLNLAKASSYKRLPSLPLNDVTRLERDLMEVRRILLKLSMNRQIVNIALQKSVQSTLLHAVSKNLFSVKKLNSIEDSVAREMKSTIEKSKLIRLWSEEVNQQLTSIMQLEEKLLGRRTAQHVRLSQVAERETVEENKTKMNAVQKTINTMNKLSSLLTIIAMQILDDDTKTVATRTEVIKLAAKWRTPRSIKYYED